MNVEVRAHRRVLGVSGDADVLACGHHVPRYGLSEGFKRLAEQGWPPFPRLRVCPSCPSGVIVLPVAFSELQAPAEVIAWWAQLGRPERTQWLDQLLPEVDAPLLRSRTPRAPLPARERKLLERVLLDVQALAEAVSLTAREYASCSAKPSPVLTGWALARAAARRYEAAQATRE